ncbi:IS66 family insertion sequence element accessory protein TnpA [Paraburkholderia terricola]|uniref:IS66 family insertion sequence element accessory protein TnpA n=1 Tax=Paraburkholderia terricola TaxID=169427 RepID=UPI0040415325
MVSTGKASGIGARRFYREQGLAVSTFSLWRKTLSSSVKALKPPLAVAADAAFIVRIWMASWRPGAGRRIADG